MRSIRLSLIVYFAALTTAALAAVSWLVYQTTAQTLEERRQSAQDFVQKQCKIREDEVTKVIDQQLARRVRTVFGLARPLPVHYEWLYPFGALSAAVIPEGHWSVDLWIAQIETRKFPRDEMHIAGAEDLLPELEAGPEYFQTYRWNGQVLQRSESLENHYLALDPALRETAQLWVEQFDEVQVEPGWNLRRVTVLVPRQRLFSRGRTLGRLGPPPGPALPSRPASDRAMLPFTSFFLQYATDTTERDKQIAELRETRDQQLVQLDHDTLANLAELRQDLLWIVAVTLSALWLGALLLIHLGLAPLARLADAVAHVSAKDFRLDIDSQKLPGELQPISARLVQTLHQLEQAFAREKQAAADISHELRTPLASLLTNVEVALRKPRSVSEYQEILHDCHLSGEQMAHLVERLLALARLDAGAVPYRPRQVDVADLTQQCADLVWPLARARGLMLRVKAPEPVPLETDPDKVREVLTNLLHNAIEYNREGGAIDVAVRRVNGHIELEVADTGIGIPPEAQPHIFERFYRVDPSRHADTPHAGLGLAIVKSYIELMSGRISVHSSAAGSTFRVELPGA